MWFNDDENERILQRYNASENAWELVRDQIAVDAYYDAVTAQEQAMFVPKVSWTDNTALTDFALIGGDITADIGYSTITSTTGVVYLTNEDFSIDGERYKTIGIRVRYEGPKNLRLLVRYKTAEHDYTNTYMAEGFYYDNGWHTVSLDMASLVAGGTDYTDSTITGIQLEISFCNYITTESGSYIEDDELVTDEVTFYPLDIAWIAIGSLTLDILNERGVSDGADVTGENTSADTEYLNGILTAQLFGNLVPEGSGLFVDGTHMGYHSETSWKTYMDSSGHFYLSGDGTHGLAWDGTTLTISGAIAVQNPEDVRLALDVSEGADVTSENTAADTELLNGLYTSTLFGTTVPAGEGLFIDGTHLGYHDGVSWKTYMDNGGNFYLSGSGTHGLAWDGETLSITGNVLVQNPSTVRAALNVADGADVTGANTALDTSLVNGTSASTVKAYAINGNTAKGYTDAWKYGSTTYINGGRIYTNTITANQIAANTITAGQIAANAIIAGKIAANAITASEIQAGTIRADEIIANGITKQGGASSSGWYAHFWLSNAYTCPCLVIHSIVMADDGDGNNTNYVYLYVDGTCYHCCAPARWTAATWQTYIPSLWLGNHHFEITCAKPINMGAAISASFYYR
jgi:hypothetical protein